MSDRLKAIQAECENEEENCSYTSTSLMVWLRSVRRRRAFFIVAPILMGGFASLTLLKDSSLAWIAPVLALVAGFFPAILEGLKVESQVAEIAAAAGEFKGLRDGFRHVRNLIAPFNEDAAMTEFDILMEKLNQARKTTLAGPEWAFEIARYKIMRGDYTNINESDKGANGGQRRPWGLPWGVPSDPNGRKIRLLVAFARSWLPW
ncbi:hypothetical protein RFN29_30650 [Mesorhizobium sp. VK22B]|uniref:SMODS and SLOG-associating 2TM effector domain-containing protein n=1 Tax=Mesorhizobium captivum TaxID=3072319 RepID=A0ABU4ZD59_9HYPH|nr:hypothetical protein [Mesorhizobium sp. VK22B]MDX8495907.1 hypothetical protein [Mesorhizobium sp. VK22B]